MSAFESAGGTRTTFCYVCPIDSLFVRGNAAFGEGGEHGASVAMPPPSLFAGAFRSALLGRNPQALARFAAEGASGDAALDECLGSPGQPGRFRLTWLSLAGWRDQGVHPLVPLPADLGRAGGRCHALVPMPWPAGVQGSGVLPMHAVPRGAAGASKPDAELLCLQADDFGAYLRGQVPDGARLVRQDQLMRRDFRLGIGLESSTRTAAESLLYTTEGHAFSPPDGPFERTGFLVGLQGIGERLLPQEGLLRLGGDGRSATWQQVRFKPPKPNLDSIDRNKAFRLVLGTPAVFERGWLPNGVRPEPAGSRQQSQAYWLHGEGFRARLVCAAVARRETISGWNLLERKPKPARSAVPAGSVYWFDRLDGPAEQLAAWVGDGLRAAAAQPPRTDDQGAREQAGLAPDAHLLHQDDLARRAEGYNLGWLADWDPGPPAR